MASFSDDFNRSDEDLTASSNWVDGLQGSSGGSLALASNRVNGEQTSGSSDGALWATTCDGDAQYAEGLIYSSFTSGGGYSDMAVSVNALTSEFTAYCGDFVNDDGTHKIELLKVDDDDWTLLTDDTHDAEGETLRIEHDGSGGLTIYSDDVEKLDYTDGSPLTGGTVGLTSWRTGVASTHLDDFAGGDIVAGTQVTATYSSNSQSGTTATCDDVVTVAGDKLIVTFLSRDTTDADRVVSAVERDGQSFTRSVNQDHGGNVAAEVWYLDAPNAGTADVTVEYGGGMGFTQIGVIVATGLADGGAVWTGGDSASSGADPQETRDAAADSLMVMCAAWNWTLTPVELAGQTSFAVHTNNYHRRASYEIAAGGSEAFGYTAADFHRAFAVAEFAAPAMRLPPTDVAATAGDSEATVTWTDVDDGSFSDDFDRADGPRGPNWTGIGRYTAVGSIEGNLLKASDLGNSYDGNIWHQPMAGEGDHFIEVDCLTDGAEDGHALCLGMTSGDYWPEADKPDSYQWSAPIVLYKYRWNSSVRLVYEGTEMDVYNLGTDVSFRARLAIEGSDAVGYIDGVERVRYTFSRDPQDPLGRYVGLVCKGGDYDNFEAGVGDPITYEIERAAGDAVSVSDDFDRADGALGANWTTATSPVWAGPNIITSNSVAGTTDGSSDYASTWNGAFGDDQWAEIDLTLDGTTTAQEGGLILRQSAGGACYFAIYAAQATQDTYRIFYHDGAADWATSPLLDTAYEAVTAATKRIRFTAVGDTLSLYADGVLKCQATHSTLTGGDIGITQWYNSTSIPVLDNFSAGDLFFPVPNQLFADDFDRADGALGSDWETISSGGSVCEIVSNTAQQPSTDSSDHYHRWQTDTLGTDHFAQADLDVSAGGAQASVCVRMQPSGTSTTDANMWLGILDNSAGATIAECNDDSWTDRASDTGVSYSSPRTVRLEAAGSTMTLLVDGVEEVQYTGATAHSDHTRAGFHSYSHTEIAVIDNFSAGDLTTSIAQGVETYTDYSVVNGNEYTYRIRSED